MAYHIRRFRGYVVIAMVFLFCLHPSVCPAEDPAAPAPDLDRILKRIEAYTPDPRYPDDPFILVTLREAVSGKQEGSGGVGACLVMESTGEIVERGHNRQYSPHFRSDLHAEMDLLNRFENRRNIQRSVDGTSQNPRQVDGLVLYSSFEPCPMCLTRIINAGIKKTLYAVPDPMGGMCGRISQLPPFWRDMARGRLYCPASCSPELKKIAIELFGHYAARITKTE